MKQSIADDIVARARKRYAEVLPSVTAYLGPTGTPTPAATVDRQVARMTPQDVVSLAASDPAAAEQAARRMEVIDARASTAPPYSDITD